MRAKFITSAQQRTTPALHGVQYPKTTKNTDDGEIALLLAMVSCVVSPKCSKQCTC